MGFYNSLVPVFRIIDKGAVVSVNLSPDFRGSGVGAEFIRQASNRFLEKRAINRIYALIRRENRVSIRVFSKAGYSKAGDEIFRGIESVRMVYQGNPII